MKILVWAVSIALGFIVAGLAFVLFAPGYDLRFVRSESMRPAINMGDLVISGPVSTAGINPGDIVTYELGENLVTHRVLSVEGVVLVTKGDDNEDSDPRPVQSSQVRGVYLFKIPFVGYLAAFVQGKTGWFLAIILPAMALVGLIVMDIVKEALKNDKTHNGTAASTSRIEGSHQET